MLVDHVLEIGREVNLAGARAREGVEGLRRQRRRAVLHCPAETVVLARHVRQLLERLEIDLDVGAHGPIGVDEAAVRRPGLYADLAQPDERGAPPLQRGVVAVHVRVQLVNVRVLAADLADFSTDRDDDARWLMLADERRELGRQVHVHLLLLGQRRLVEVDERRGVDVDVVEAGGDLLLDQRAQPGELLVAIGTVVFLRIGLDVIALNEQRAGKALAQRRTQDHGDVLVGPLLGVPDFRARDLEDERAGFQLLRGADDGARGVVRHRAHVDRRHGEAAGVAAAHGHVEVVDRGRPDAGRRRKAADDPARGPAKLGVLAEHRRPHETVHKGAGDRPGVADADAVAQDGGRRLDGVAHLSQGLERHGGAPMVGVRAYGKGLRA